MLYNKSNNVFKKNSGLLQVLVAICVIVASAMFFSCNKPTTTPYSDNSYKKILDSASHMYDAGKCTKAVHFLDSATNNYKALELHQRFEYYKFNCNYFFHFKKDNNKAMRYADSMLNLFNTPQKRLMYIADYGFSFFSKGDVLFAQSKYNEAYQYYYQGRLIAKKDINDCAISDYSYRMGMIMYQQEHFRLAAANFKSSLKETNACSLTFRSFYRRQELLDNTGLCYSKINEPDSALMFYTNALDYIEKEGIKFPERKGLLDVARAVVYGNEAKIYIQRNNFHIAEMLLKKSIAINLMKGNDNRDAEISELRLAHLYYQLNKIDSLKNLLQVVRPQFDTVKNLDAEADWNFIEANYFTDQNDPKTALKYFVKYDALKDSITDQNKALKEADIAGQIKKLEKDNELDDLKRNNNLQSLYLKIEAVFAFMLVIILFLILLTWRKSKRNIKTLGSLNSQINKQNYNLENALDELKLSSEEKDRILRTVAHDLRNPIGGIASLTNAMAGDDYTPEQKEMISLIKETSHNSLELINEILEITDNESAPLKKEFVEVNSLLHNSIELLRYRAGEKNQKIILEPSETPEKLLISREKIWRVMSNLIINAIKFSPDGSDIFVKITNHENDVEIAVKDSGIGIPDDIKNNVFNIFTEAKRPGTSGEKSFGLGLSICKQIIENHNGKIWFESNINNGTTFYVSLPKNL